MVDRESITSHQLHGIVRLIVEDLHNQKTFESICNKRGIRLRTVTRMEGLVQHIAGLVLNSLDYTNPILQRTLASLSLSAPHLTEEEKAKDRKLIEYYENME